jgi:tetratricopeptide (TPR) repeat protein
VRPDLTRAGMTEVALLRSFGRQAEAEKRLRYWREQDPTNTMFRYEAVRLGRSDPALLAHLAGDPQRILEIAVNYMDMGLYADALDVLSQKYPTGPEVVSEPGTPPVDQYPLIAYYRGFCRYALRLDDRVDFEAAASMPTSYVFPSRAETFAVLRRALEFNPQDASAHFLLGELYLATDRPQPALEHWEAARRLRPSIPALHRNMGYTALFSGGSLQQAMDLFREGTKYDSHNVDVYLGLEEAMKKAGRPAAERAQALESFPEMQTAPAALVFRTIDVLAEAGQFDEAEKLLEHRFFPREEGGKTAGDVYVNLRLRQASALAARHDCKQALSIAQTLTDPNATVPGTKEKIVQYVETEFSRHSIEQVRTLCP